jgi:hypothetical protein
MSKRAAGVDGDTPANHAGVGGSNPTAALFRKAEYRVCGVSHADATAMVEAYHYARGGSNTAVYTHGLFHCDRPLHCLGVAWWLPPTPDCGRRWWPDDEQKVLSLSRLVLVPELPKNAATFLMMMSVRLIRKRGDKWRCLITQADTWRGHTGHIYKVAGWEECGLGKPEDVWTDATGRMVSRKAGPKTRSRDQMKALGYKFEGKFAKWRFRLTLPEPKEKPNLFTGMGDERASEAGTGPTEPTRAGADLPSHALPRREVDAQERDTPAGSSVGDASADC